MAHAASSRCRPVPPVMAAPGVGEPPPTSVPLLCTLHRVWGCPEALPQDRRGLPALAPGGRPQDLLGHPRPQHRGCRCQWHRGAPRDFPEPSKAQNPRPAASRECWECRVRGSRTLGTGAGVAHVPQAGSAQGALPCAAAGNAAPAPCE